MPYSNISVTWPGADKAAFELHMTSAGELVPFVINLTPEERQKLPAVQDERYPFVQKIMDQYIISNPSLIPSFADVTEARKDWQLTKDFDNPISLLNQLLEKMVDTRHAASYETYKFCLDFYANVERAKEANVPGADAIFNDLKPLFEKATIITPVTPEAPGAGGGS